MLIGADGALPSRRVMVLHLTYLCNLRCHYCYVEKDRHHMPLEDVRRSIDFFVDKLAAGPDSTIFFMGGEPLAVPELLKASVDHARARGVESFGIISNGTLLDREWLEYLIRRRFFVHLSVDGVRPAQDANRPQAGGKGSFDLVDKALDLLSENSEGLQHLELRHTFTPESLPHLAESVRYYATKACIDRARLSFMPAMLPAGRWDALTAAGRLAPALREQVDGIVDVYLAQRRRGRTLNLYYNECLSDTAPLSEASKPEPYSCKAGEIAFAVNMNGDIFPCHAPAPHPEFADNGRWRLGDIRSGLTRPDRAAGYLGAPHNVHQSCPHWNRINTGDPAKPAPVFTAFYAAWLGAIRRLRAEAGAS